MNQIIDKLIQVFKKIPIETMNTYNKFLITNRSKFCFILFLFILLGMVVNNIFDNAIAYGLLISTLAIIFYDYYYYKPKNTKLRISKHDNTELASDSDSGSDPDSDKSLGGGSLESFVFFKLLSEMKNEYETKNQESKLDNELFQSIFLNTFLIPILGEKGTRIFYRLFTIGVTAYVLPSYIDFFKNILGFDTNKSNIKTSSNSSTGGIEQLFTAIIGAGLPLLLIGSIINLFKLIFDDNSNVSSGGSMQPSELFNLKGQGSSESFNLKRHSSFGTINLFEGGSNNILSWLYSLLSKISNIKNDIINEINSMLNIPTLSKNEYKITFNDEYNLDSNLDSNFNINKSKLYQDYNLLKINMPNKLSNKSNEIIMNKIISLEKLKEEINSLYNLIVNSSKALSLGYNLSTQHTSNLYDLNGLTEDTMKLLVNEYKQKIKTENKETEKIKKIFNKINII